MLVADDNEFNLFTFKQILKNNYNLESDGAFDGSDAVKKFVKSLSCCPYRVVFMDVNMPVMDGLEATRKIREIIKEHLNAPEYHEYKLNCEIKGKKFIPIDDFPIVALTANDTLLERQRCIDAGMQSFLSKPPDFIKLKQKLIEIFGKEFSTGFK